MAKLLFVSGSTRTGSYNTLLTNQAVSIARKLDNAAITPIDLRNFEMPLYHGDIEATSGLPDTAKKLKKLFIEHQGIFISSPEYNSSFSPLLKNSLDWISRKSSPEEADLIAFKGKVVALASASPGNLGGMRGLVPLRLMLSNIHVLVLPTQVCISSAHAAFDEQGTLKDKKHEIMLTSLIQQLIETTHKQNA